MLNLITFRIFEIIMKNVSHSPFLIRRVHHGVRKVIYVACEKYFWKEINVFVKSGISFSREL